MAGMLVSAGHCGACSSDNNDINNNNNSNKNNNNDNNNNSCLLSKKWKSKFSAKVLLMSKDKHFMFYEKRSKFFQRLASVALNEQIACLR